MGTTKERDQQRLERLRQALAARQWDGIMFTSPEDLRYVTGFTGGEGACLVSGSDQVLFVDFRYVTQAQEEAPSFRLVRFEDLIQALRDEIVQQRLQTVAYEGLFLPVRRFQKMQQALPHVNWVDQENLIEQLRAIKEPQEIAAIERAAALADLAFDHLRGFIQAGQTEQEIALELEFFLRSHGSEGVSFPSIVASGPNGALPHAQPGPRRLQRGDLVVLDFGAVVDGYHSDMTRTVVVEEADEQAKKVYQIVLAAQQAGLEAVRPGRSGRDVDAEARQVIAAAGYGEYFGHGLGHGVGLAIHEDPPRLSARAESTLAVNMVVTVEPGIYLPGWGGVRIEDLVVVTATGCRILSHSPKELIRVG